MGIQTAPFVVPLAMTLFLFILIANWLAIIPTGHHPEYAPPPASDVNLTYALALFVIVTMHVAGVRKNGLRGYYAHLFRKPYMLVPLNILEELIKPITLALRLFGNIFAGTIMVALHRRAARRHPVGARDPVEAVRHVHRADPGLHLRPADRAVPQLGQARRGGRTPLSTLRNGTVRPA